MANSLTLVEISAFSGLAGALLTQLVTAFNTYLTDRRKQSFELGAEYRARKAETGEHFYFMTGEKMAAIKKNVGYWRNWNNSRSSSSLQFLTAETRQFNAQLEKLDSENWKYNLVEMYYGIEFTQAKVHESNDRSHRLYLAYLDVADRITGASEDETETLYQRYATIVFEMCGHYEQVYQLLERDRQLVRNELAGMFARIKI
ncbi:MAG TPA: hypothetical protein VIM55_10030 [Mucilaginibacter sp.]